MISKRRSLRTAVVGALGAASLALAGTAMAATPATHTASPVAVAPKAPAAKAGSKVTLQQKQHGTWVSLPASAPIARNGSYSLGVKLGLKGRNDLRIVSGTTASPVFGVTVR